MPYPDRDDEYLSKLQNYYAETRRIPSHKRFGELIGLSKAGAEKLLKRLSVAGFITRTPDDDAWIPSGRFFERPLFDTAVRAGNPDMIEGTGAEPFLVDDYLIRHPSSTIMLPVKGDSMIEAGIHEGDIIAVDRKKAAKVGSFVVAIVDNEFTLKELGTERGKFILKPHNKACPIIRPKNELEIFGVMVGLVRRLAS